MEDTALLLVTALAQLAGREKDVMKVYANANGYLSYS